MSKSKIRCGWVSDDPLYIKYHDSEWGVPVRNDRKLFELLTLEGAQAGLSWITVLRKREHYRTAFANFKVEQVARFDRRRITQLMNNPGLVRNRLKLESTVTNAQAFLEVQEEFGSFGNYLWGFVNGSPIVTRRKSHKLLPPRTRESDLLSKDLKKRGFRFVGSTTCYAYMQAVGMVDDHIATCFRAT